MSTSITTGKAGWTSRENRLTYGTSPYFKGVSLKRQEEQMRWSWLILAFVPPLLALAIQKDQPPQYNVRVNVVSLDVEVLERTGDL